MKQSLIALAVLAAATASTGCAGLSINADFTLMGTYRSNIVPGTYGVDAKPKAAPIPSGKPS